MAGGARHKWLGIMGIEVAFLLACRASAGFASAALNRFARPAMEALHRLTAPIPFPLAEPAALLLAALPLTNLLTAVLRAAFRRSRRPLHRAAAGLLAAAAIPLGGLLALWEPARCAVPAESPPTPDAEPLEWLCGELIDALNASSMAFSPFQSILRVAPEVADMPGCVVKAARYPEWMRAANVSGLFVPLTGEILVDVGAPAPLIPFTAVHELTHLSGIADEGAANIAAWERCMAAEGEFADSARLWALRYALALLHRADEAAWVRIREKISGAPKRALDMCGEASLSASASPVFPMPSLSLGDYASLVGYLTTFQKP